MEKDLVPQHKVLCLDSLQKEEEDDYEMSSEKNKSKKKRCVPEMGKNDIIGKLKCFLKFVV